MPPPDALPWRQRWRAGAWSLALRSDQGGRERLEDAWAVVPRVDVAGRACAVAAVFDGLGGEPFGQEAAWMAADHLEDSLAAVSRPQDLLAHLNEWVR